MVAQNENFQPMNANFGLLPLIETTIRDKKLKKQAYADRAINEIKIIAQKNQQEVSDINGTRQ